MGVYGSESSGLRQGAADHGLSGLSHDMSSSQNGYGMGVGSGITNNYGTLGSGNLGSGHLGVTPAAMPVSTSRDDFSNVGQGVDNVAAKQRAKANYAYTASPDDPNEVSFTKGETLEVLDTAGKWFQVRTSSGQTGVSFTTPP